MPERFPGFPSHYQSRPQGSFGMRRDIALRRGSVNNPHAPGMPGGVDDRQSDPLGQAEPMRATDPLRQSLTWRDPIHVDDGIAAFFDPDLRAVAEHLRGGPSNMLRSVYELQRARGDMSADTGFESHRVNRDKAGRFSAQWQVPRWRTAKDEKLLTLARQRARAARDRIVADEGVAHDRMAMDHMPVSLRRGSRSFLVLAMDQAASLRRYSPDGHLHVGDNIISRASVNPYWGSEIPDAEKHGLDPKKKYWLLRHPDELAKAAGTFNNIPLLIEHRPVSADDHPSDLVVGATGTDAVYQHPFLKNSLVVWTKPAIDAIAKGEQRELSCAYHYDYDPTPGVWEGKHYDGVMRNIAGNHLALVPDGRVGPVAVVHDAMPWGMR
jgi:hypothetical protein